MSCSNQESQKARGKLNYKNAINERGRKHASKLQQHVQGSKQPSKAANCKNAWKNTIAQERKQAKSKKSSEQARTSRT